MKWLVILGFAVASAIALACPLDPSGANVGTPKAAAIALSRACGLSGNCPAASTGTSNSGTGAAQP